MERIKLSDGSVCSFITNENGWYKFYRCETYQEACALHMTLTDLGNKCEIDKDRYGWYVRVKR